MRLRELTENDYSEELKRAYEEAKRRGPPAVLFHSTASENRKSILKNGLRLEHSEAAQMAPKNERHLAGAIFFSTKPGRRVAGYDTWRVDVRGLHLELDDTTDWPDPTDPWWQTFENIDPSRLTLLPIRESVLREWTGHGTYPDKQGRQIEYGEEFWDSYKGESFGALYAKIGDEVVGKISLSVYQGHCHIKMIDVEPEFQRSRIATQMVNILYREYGKENVEWSGTTDEGEALRRSMMESEQVYPKSAPAAYIFNLVRRIHSRQQDFDEGDIGNRIWRFIRYELKTIPIQILKQEWAIHQDLVDRYATMPASTIPPIVFDPISHSIIDGAHRVEVAKQHGNQFILAYVGTDPDPNWSEEVHYDS